MFKRLIIFLILIPFVLEAQPASRITRTDTLRAYLADSLYFKSRVRFERPAQFDSLARFTSLISGDSVWFSGVVKLGTAVSNGTSMLYLRANADRLYMMRGYNSWNSATSVFSIDSMGNFQINTVANSPAATLSSTIQNTINGSGARAVHTVRAKSSASTFDVNLAAFSDSYGTSAGIDAAGNTALFTGGSPTGGYGNLAISNRSGSGTSWIKFYNGSTALLDSTNLAMTIYSPTRKQVLIGKTTATATTTGKLQIAATGATIENPIELFDTNYTRRWYVRYDGTTFIDGTFISNGSGIVLRDDVVVSKSQGNETLYPNLYLSMANPYGSFIADFSRKYGSQAFIRFSNDSISDYRWVFGMRSTADNNLHLYSYEMLNDIVMWDSTGLMRTYYGISNRGDLLSFQTSGSANAVGIRASSTDGGGMLLYDGATAGYIPVLDFYTTGNNSFGLVINARTQSANDVYTAGRASFILRARKDSTGTTALSNQDILLLENGTTDLLLISATGKATFYDTLVTEKGLRVGTSTPVFIKADGTINTTSGLSSFGGTNSGTATIGAGDSVQVTVTGLSSTQVVVVSYYGTGASTFTKQSPWVGYKRTDGFTIYGDNGATVIYWIAKK